MGIGLLLLIVLGMSGIYRGMIDDALVVLDHIGADLWVVQRGTRGPFAEISRVAANLEDRLRAVPGVVSARRFVSHNVQREHAGRRLRMNVQGLAWPEDRGEWVNLVAGRLLAQAHQIASLPTLSLFWKGREVNRIMGARPAQAIQQWLEQVFALANHP